jgi:hypothetical protein
LILTFYGTGRKMTKVLDFRGWHREPWHGKSGPVEISPSKY